MKLKPSSLFKYLTINKNTMSALIGNYLYFSSPMNFNDPFDSRLHLFGEGNDELWEKYFLKNGLESIPKDHKKAIKQQLFDLEEIHPYESSIDVHMDSRVYCLSKENTSILMWSHYASDHSGLCVEYKTTEIINDDPKPNDKSIHILQFNESDIKYETDTSLKPNQICAIQVNYQEDLPEKLNFLKIDPIQYKDFIFTKHINWKYEKEFRIYINSKSISNGQSARLIYDSIANIYFGLKTNQSDINTIITIIKSNPDYQNIGFYKMKSIPGKYAVEPISI